MMRIRAPLLMSAPCRDVGLPVGSFPVGIRRVAVAGSGRREISRRAVLGTGAVLLGSAGLTAAGVKVSDDPRHTFPVAGASPSSTPTGPCRPSGKTKEYWVQAGSFSHN